MTASLDNLVRGGQLKRESPAQQELDGLVHSGHARLQDAENMSVSLEGRFDLAYNAAHALSLAALRWHGYRSENRYLVFQTLAHTLKLPAEQWRVLDSAHRKRNVSSRKDASDPRTALKRPRRRPLQIRSRNPRNARHYARKPTDSLRCA